MIITPKSRDALELAMRRKSITGGRFRQHPQAVRGPGSADLWRSRFLDLERVPQLVHGCRMRSRRHQPQPCTGNGRVQAHSLNLFVLAVLLLRALVPAGFMLAPVNGQLVVVLCDADATASMHQHSGHDHALHHHADHGPMGHDRSGGHTHPDPTCPFAQSAGATPLPTVPALADATQAALRVSVDRFAQTHSHFGPARQQSPRAPPRLA